ncbi:MAG: hypothetical protein HQK52_03180 [Oligoflexia bacterium]|nr:hypothetical protein [Oligoflexia bacterium]
MLRALADSAKGKKVSFGSVGIYPPPPREDGTQVDETGLIRYVCFPGKTWDGIREFVLESGIPSLVPVIIEPGSELESDNPFNCGDTGAVIKRASRTARKHRLAPVSV